MRDGFELVARIPYPSTSPKFFATASEVATINYVRSNSIPAPQVYGYSTTSENAAGTEYILMEFIRGTNLSDVWYELKSKDREKVMANLVELEAKLFALQLPASGGLYHTIDLDKECPRVPLINASDKQVTPFCVGPSTARDYWKGKRSKIAVDRGPCACRPRPCSYPTTTDLSKLRRQSKSLKPVPGRKFHILKSLGNHYCPFNALTGRR